jgi:thiol-disulfide isomerase/thioredoxin
VTSAVLGVGLGLAALAPPAAAAERFELAGTTLRGDTLTAADLAGRIVLVEFWATWCPPCREQLGRLAALERQRDDLVVVAVNLDTRRDKVERYAARNTLPQRVLLDPSGRIAERAGVAAMPWALLLDAGGRVVWSQPAAQTSAAQVLRDVERLKRTHRKEP